jgi:hypothetical protein
MGVPKGGGTKKKNHKHTYVRSLKRYYTAMDKFQPDKLSSGFSV